MSTAARTTLRRVARVVVTVFGVVTVAFFVQRLGGSPAALLLPVTATPSDVADLDHALGYDRPLLVQYGEFLLKALHGDLGQSLREGVPALGVVLDRFPATALLAVAAFGFGVGTAFLLVIVLRVTGSARLRSVVVWLGQLRLATPTFLFGILLVLVFSVWLRALPSVGDGGFRHLVLPAVTLGTFEIALYVRLLDASFGEQETQDYVRTARAKGGGRLGIVLRHMLPNALLPVVTVMGLHLGSLLSGAVVIETLFNWPGVGSLVIESINGRDFPVVIAAVLVVSAVFVVLNVLVDLLYAAIDPRVGASA